ncbi:MAG: FG-GAP-like repeat-containing protein [SAR202 cluster bacterium]|nr:FG-GAP-like repeat-containing protein [SAR202 cluster bacterium]
MADISKTMKSFSLKYIYPFNTDLKKRRLVGTTLVLLLLLPFLTLNRFPKIETIDADLAIVTSPATECFQGFCLENLEDKPLVERWWNFSLTYLRNILIGMLFAFLMAGITEAFLFPRDIAERFTGKGFKGIFKGILSGPVVNLCSACIVPIANAFRKTGASVETTIALTQSSSTLNLLSLVMVILVFSPQIGTSRIALSIIGALLLGPLVGWISNQANAMKTAGDENDLRVNIETNLGGDGITWKESLLTAFLLFGRSTVTHTLKLGPIMVIAGFVSGLVIQWISPQTVTTWIGDDVLGIVVAASIGIAINVPLMFEIPLVAAMLLAGMGSAPAGALLFTAAAGGPVTFWGLGKVIPKRGVAMLGISTWLLGISGGFAVLIFMVMTESDRHFSFRADYSSSSGSRPEDTNSYQQDEFEALLQPDKVKLASEVSPFKDVSQAVGFNFKHTDASPIHVDLGAGVVVFDLDNDNVDEIYVINSEGANALFKQDENHRFRDVGGTFGLDDIESWGNSGCAGDIDNDGFPEIYVANYGASKLFHNRQGSGFEDITYISGLSEEDLTVRAMGCAWSDYDGDGLLDLVILRHYHEWKPHLASSLDFQAAIRPLKLFHNLGGSKFEDVTDLLGDTTFPVDYEKGTQAGNVWGAGFQPVWADFDDDGDQDLYIVNDFGFAIQRNVMWRNDGLGLNGTWEFKDVSNGSGSDLGIFGMGAALGDYDLDGDLDLYITNIGQNVHLRNDGEMNFVDSTNESGTGIPNIGVHLRVSWGAVFFDYDNDGDEDLYVVSGDFRGISKFMSTTYQPNALLQNRGDGTFIDISSISDSDDVNSGRSVATIDFNDDGCLDLVLTNFDGSAALLENTCNYGNNWLKVKLRALNSNNDAIGAKLEINANGRKQIRQVGTGSGSLGQGPLISHFGLGETSILDSVVVIWPGGKRQELRDVAPNQTLQILENK